jgi:hypothetical protein
MLPKYNNILLVSGTGRNVGKTFMSCSIINKFKGKNIVAIKISPHFHEINPESEILISNEKFQIIEEKTSGNKDSMKMLKAGASKVFYIQVLDEKLLEAFHFVIDKIGDNTPVIIESGALQRFIQPGLIVCLKGENPKKDCPKKAVVLEKDEEKEKFLKNIFYELGYAHKTS